ncbi:MAG: hypothetical protein G8345_18900 [Magnetococcales bacterium]|nr:hypothetical protein [Magnetococcales bacterium]NGZ28943.1 hypothetical protein [Magnetococcales bacterium]
MNSRNHTTFGRCVVWWLAGLLALMVTGCAERVGMGVYTPVNLQPVNFWWHFNPSKNATWDYFSPIPDDKQPITILQREGPLPEAAPQPPINMAMPPQSPQPVFPPGYGVYR